MGALATTACLALAIPTHALAQGLPVAVELETDFEGEDPEFAKRLQPVLEDRARSALESSDVEVDGAAATKIIIYVRNLAEKPSRTKPSDYAVVAEVVTDGKPAEPTPYYCSDTEESALVDCVVDGLAPVIESLPERQEPAPPPEPDDPSEVIEPRPAEPQPTERVAPIGPVGAVGLVLGAGGIAMITMGVVDLRTGEEVTLNRGREDVVDHRPRGRALLGSGIAAVALGVVAVGVDVGMRARKRRGTKQVGFHISARPTFAGLSINGRF